MYVTVGLPVYNASRFLALAIASIIGQSFRDWQLIAIDDGSTDDSLGILAQFNDPRIRILSDGQNLGLAARLNQIAELAETPYIARMDADDVMHPYRLERQLAYLREHPSVDLVGSQVFTIDVSNQVYGWRSSTVPQSKHHLFSSSPFIHPSILGRRTWFKQWPYDPNYDRAEDFELWVRSFEASKFAVLEEKLLFYRELGLPYLGKYLRTSHTVRRVIGEKAPGVLSRKEINQLLLNSVLKDRMYWAFNRLGRESELLLRRNQPLSAAQQIEAHDALRYIRSFVPETLR